MDKKILNKYLRLPKILIGINGERIALKKGIHLKVVITKGPKPGSEEIPEKPARKYFVFLPAGPGWA